MSPTPIRLLVDIRGEDHSLERSHEAISESAIDGNIYRFLEQPGFSESLLKNLIEEATELAETEAGQLRAKASETAEKTLKAALKRLIDLRKINDHVRLEEIEHAQEQLDHTVDAIKHARLRLDSIRVIVEGKIRPLL